MYVTISMHGKYEGKYLEIFFSPFSSIKVNKETFAKMSDELARECWMSSIGSVKFHKSEIFFCSRGKLIAAVRLFNFTNKNKVSVVLL